MRGDTNFDNAVDTIDISSIGKAFLSSPGSPMWNPTLDMNSDMVIDIFDMAEVGIDFGNEYRE